MVTVWYGNAFGDVDLQEYFQEDLQEDLLMHCLPFLLLYLYLGEI